MGSGGVFAISRSGVCATVEAIFVASPSLSLPELWSWYVMLFIVSSRSESHCGGEYNDAKCRPNPGEKREKQEYSNLRSFGRAYPRGIHLETELMRFHRLQESSVVDISVESGRTRFWPEYRRVYPFSAVVLIVTWAALAQRYSSGYRLFRENAL